MKIPLQKDWDKRYDTVNWSHPIWQRFTLMITVNPQTRATIREENATVVWNCPGRPPAVLTPVEQTVILLLINNLKDPEQPCQLLY